MGAWEQPPPPNSWWEAVNMVRWWNSLEIDFLFRVLEKVILLYTEFNNSDDISAFKEERDSEGKLKITVHHKLNYLNLFVEVIN